MTEIKPVAWTSKKGLRHLATMGFLAVGKHEDRERKIPLYGPEAADEITRLRQILSEAQRREMEARAKALEDFRELLQFTKWSASVYHCPPPRSKRDNPLKHSSIIRLQGSFDTEAEALSAASAAIKSGWAGTTIIHEASAKPLAQFNIQNGVADAIGRLAFAGSALKSEER